MTAPLETLKDEAAAWFGRRRIGGLGPEGEAAFAEWLAADPAHAEAYVVLERAWFGVESLRGDPRVLAFREEALRRHPRWRPWAARIAMAAALAVAVIGGGWLAGEAGLIGHHRLRTEAFRTDVGEQREVTLPDGSVVTLNTDTILRTQADGARRLLYLDKGQAFFKVAHDGAHPFVVNAGGRTVTAIGTAFEVRVDPGRFEVTLLEGKVRVEAPVPAPLAAASAPAAPRARAEPPPPRLQATEMVAGTQLLASTDAAWKLEEVDAAREVAWTRGQLVFLTEPLGDVVAELNRYSTAKIVIADAALAAIPITGTFKPGDNAGFARAVASYGMASAQAAEDGTIRLTQKKTRGPT